MLIQDTSITLEEVVGVKTERLSVIDRPIEEALTAENRKFKELRPSMGASHKREDIFDIDNLDLKHLAKERK